MPGARTSALRLPPRPLRTNTATTVTTTKGAFTEFVPASETIVVRTETNPAPLRYVVTKETTIVDEAGVPVAVAKISPGSPLSVNYTGTGDRLVASRIVVHKAPAPVVTAPAPVVTDRPATTTTTTTTTRPLTDEEKKAVKKEVEKQKEKADEAKDKAEDDED